ncbi:MAG: long-chain fatty acid--CoA ligase [Armatimonadetes bacterium CG07_land_8_20_14_0_80_40_9]|nr:MAG: long-chain fatty acid--CoA ligase [Armatimonadetes bacterium CG07_land_8_20_14_0_80_40_9]
MEKVWHKFYEEGVPKEIDYPDVPLYQFLDDTAKKFPDVTATLFFGAKITYRELGNLVERFATSLHSLGIKKGDRVALILPNCPQSIISYYALLKLGAIIVQTNPMYVERELQYQLNDSGTETVILLDFIYPRIKRIKKDTKLKNIIVTSIKDYLPFPLNLLYPIKQRKEGQFVKIKRDEVYLFNDLIRGAKGSLPKVNLSAEDVALLQYTGGTTGISKGVMLTHKNLVANVLQGRYWVPEKYHHTPGEEIMLCVIPFFHVYGMTVCMNLAIYAGATMLLVPRFQIEETLSIITKYKPTMFPGIPTLYAAINNYKDLKKYDLSSIGIMNSGAAPLPLEIMEKFEQKTGGKIVEGYGLTESSPACLSNPLYGRRKEGSIGIPMADTEAKIVDLETGEKEVSRGEVGELCIKGPQVMKGYWNKEEETKATIRDGWLYTGDIAKVDAEGYFYIVDRKKDLIIAGGYNIYPREIDEVLYEHPKILEACAAGIPDKYRGETVKAYIVLKEGETLTEEEVIKFCKERLAPYKVPKIIEFRKELPKSMVGKVLRKILREEEAKKLGQNCQ